jgi:Uma2 family endonuclease
VLSDSTRLYDLNGKFEKYKHIPSFKEYVLVNQKKVEVEVRSLQENGDWTKKIYRKIEDKAVLTSIGFEMPLGDIYEGIL